MIKNIIKIFILSAVMFVSVQGAGSKGSFETFYEKELKPSLEKIKPLKEYAKKKRTTYIISAVIALVVFALFVKYFKLTGAVVALAMIAGGVFYLKSAKPVINPYKELFNKEIISKIGNFCCGYEYKRASLSREDVINSKLFSPKIKHFTSEGLFVKDGVRFGYATIEFDTKEDESVERFAENVFKGFIVETDRKNDKEGVMITDTFKEKVADIDPEFNAFFSPLPRDRKEAGFEIYANSSWIKIGRYHMLAYRDIALAFTKNKTYIFYIYNVNPLAVSLYDNFTLKEALKIKSIFEDIDALVKTVTK